MGCPVIAYALLQLVPRLSAAVSRSRRFLPSYTLPPSMFRPTLRTLSQAQSQASAATGLNSRRQRGRGAILIAAALTGAFAAYALTPRKSEWDENVPHDIRPSLHWSPPTRTQMIEALKKGSPDSLRSDGSLEQMRSLLVPEHKAVGSSPIPEVEHAYSGSNDNEGFDLLIIGGGATGAGVAIDATTRGLKVAVVERDDYGAGTSSKSTKLVHGGVRYLQKAIMQLDYDQYKMVREALHERKTFLHIAPYLSHSLPILIPAYAWWKIPYYYAGTKLYDLIAGEENMGSSYMVSRDKTLEMFPMLRPHNLAGGVVYYDGQQNDTRMNIALILSAIQHGAVAANHTEVISLIKTPGADGKEQITGARVRDRFTDEEFNIKAKVRLLTNTRV